MKKIFLSSLVILGFLGYSLYLKTKGVNQMPIVTPSVVTQTQSQSTPTPSPISPTSPTSNTVSKVPPPATPTPTSIPQSGYKDGTYTGDAADAFYGNIQVQATIRNGKITDVQFLQYPNDRGTSIEINSQVDPMLAQEAIQNQTAQVDIISGATDSSQAFVQSLQSALDKAKS